MNANTARNLCRKRIDIMSIEELQSHKIRLLDAWRESTGEYFGIPQAVRDGFMIRIICHQANGYSPKDIWLSRNLMASYEDACQKERFLLDMDEMEFCKWEKERVLKNAV